MNGIKTNRITAALIFVFSFIIYLSTMAPTVSFWDCGEFIACSRTMAVPHPPGAPLYLIVARLFSMIPFSPDIAFRINLISALSSAITIMLLYLIIVHLVQQWKGKFEEKEDWLIAVFSGIIGSLCFAFTHSFWFNAVEAELYAPSMLFTSLIVWLILVWHTKSDEPGNEKYLLMIAYLIGLAVAVHLLNVLALPFVVMIYYYKHYEFNLKSFLIMTAATIVIILAIYPGMVKYVPLLALKFGPLGLAAFFIVIIGFSMWAINNHKHVMSLIFLSILLISIGYSTYATIYIRSNLNPMIDENNPETIENFIKYINREQYGDHSILDRRGVWKNSPNGKHYKSASDYFWNYQVHKMYNRYFLWQFVGMDENESDWSTKQFWALPLFLGLFGIYWHFRRDPKRALAVLALFFATGLAIVLYLNQPDPQPRERDYSYVGSFFAFSIWVGLGYAGVLDLIKEFMGAKSDKLKPVIMYAAFVVLLLIVPINMLAKNYHSHDRSGNYVAWDYSYNMLMSCEPNAILFTNGDNDTFPLWYLQEVEGVRKDVRIANLSLLNTDWYISQLRDLEPTVPMRMSDAELSRLGLRPWKKQKVTVKVPHNVAMEAQKEFKEKFSFINIDLPEKITFEVKPAMNTRYGPVIRTQDMMILNIIAANRWKRPIYFAVTVPQKNMLSGLSKYMRMDGLVLKLVPYKNWRISPTNIRKNLMEVYQYRGLDDPDVYYNGNILALLQNYRSAYIQLAEYYVRQNDNESLKEILKMMDKNIRPDVIPWKSKYLSMIKDAFYVVTDSSYIDTIFANVKTEKDLQLLGEHLLRLRDFKSAAKILEEAYQSNPRDAKSLGLLINAYNLSGNREKAVKPLEEWLVSYPNDKNARKILESIKSENEN
jgi:tetratricopeptide (TPR) repeat protein